MTGAEVLAYVKRTFKRTDKDTEIYEALTDTIADIRKQMHTEDFKEEAYTSGIDTLGEYRLALPDDYGHIIGNITIVDDDNSFCELNKIDKQTYDLKYGDRHFDSYSDTYSGQPTDFCIYGKQIFLGPVPDKTSYNYNINYTTEDYAAITATTADVPFSGRDRKMLRAGALADVYSGLEFFQEASVWGEIYLAELIKLQSNDELNIDDSLNVSYHGV